MQQGDLKPELVLWLTDEYDAPVAFDPFATAVTVLGSGANTFTRPAVAGPGGKVTMTWQPGDTAKVGRIDLRVQVTWPDGIQTFDIDGGVEIEPASPNALLVTVQDLSDHMSGVTFDAGQLADARRTLAGLQRGLERRLRRRLAPGQATDRAFTDERGWAALSRSPVKSIVSVATTWGQPFSWDVTWLTTTRDGVAGLTPRTWLDITYVGGGLDDDVLEDVKLALLEKASTYMTNRHDDTQSVKELSTREPTAAAAGWHGVSTGGWSDADLDNFGLSQLRRIVVL